MATGVFFFSMSNKRKEQSHTHTRTRMDLADAVIAGTLFAEKDKTKSQRLIMYGVIGFIVLSLVVTLGVTYGTAFTRTIAVHRTYTGVKVGNTHYFVETTDDTIYEVESSMLWGFFEPAELWNRFAAGKRYTVRGFGMRVGVLGWYPTIVHAEEA